jgi:hypothetical protein
MLVLSGLALIIAATAWRPAPTLAQLPAGAPVYNANAKWVTDHGSQVFNVMAYGAKCDGVTDDAAAIQAAINAANPDTTLNWPGAGMTLVPGPCAIGSTLTLRGILTGTGIGTPSKSGSSSYLKWLGPAGQPMVLITTWKASVRDLHFKGNSSAPPSEAIQISTYPNTSVAYGDMGNIRDVMIGSVGGDSDTGKQFVNGITWNGTTGGDSWWISDVQVSGCTGNGINDPNPNASDMHIENLYVSGCAVGWYGSGQAIYGTNWEMSNNTLDLQLLGGSDLNLHGFVSSGSRQFIVNAGGRLAIDGGSWMPPNSSANINIIDNSQGQSGFITLRNFYLLYNGSYTGTETILACSSSTSGPPQPSNLRLINTTGIPASMISCPFNWNYGNGSQSGIIEYRPHDGTGLYHTDGYNILSKYTGYTFDWTRHDFEHQYNFWGGPVELMQVSSGFLYPSCTPTGSGSTSYGYRVTATTGQYLGGASGVLIGGETAPSAEVTCSNAATLSSSNYNTIAVYPAIGASGYNIYCRTPNSEQLCASIPATPIYSGSYYTWVDNGSATPSGALPAANTTGRLVGGTLNANWAWTENLDIGADGHGYFTSVKSGGLSATVTVASGTAALGIALIAPGACASAVSVAASGVLTTDTIKFTPNGDPTGVAGYGVSSSGAVLSVYAYPTSGYVNFKVCNSTSGSITPGALTLNWEVTR